MGEGTVGSIRPRGPRTDRREQPAMVVDHGDILGTQSFHARRHKMDNALHLALVQIASGLQTRHHRRGHCRSVLAQENRLLGERDLDPRCFDRLDLLDTSRELTLHRALVVHLLDEIGDPEVALVEDLEANAIARGKPLGSEPDTRLVNHRSRHVNRGASFFEAMSDVLGGQAVDDRSHRALVESAEEQPVLRVRGPVAHPEEEGERTQSGHRKCGLPRGRESFELFSDSVQPIGHKVFLGLGSSMRWIIPEIRTSAEKGCNQ